MSLGKAFQKSDELPFDLGDSMQFIAYATDTNGNVHEYLPQSSKILEDKELCFIYNALPTEDYTLENSDCQWNFSNMQEDSLYVINSEEGLLAFITCPDDETPPAIDFTKYTLLLARGTTMYGSIADISKQLMQLSANDYGLNIGLHLSDTADPQAWQIAVLVPKVNEVKFNLYYPHIEVWVCTLKWWNPNIIITLTFDTLRGEYYGSTFPQDLGYLKPWDILFFDGEGGKYLFCQGGKLFARSWTISSGNFDCDNGDIHSSLSFTVTMLSSDTMQLERLIGPILTHTVSKYLFIKQNSNF